ncbi:hypothetical protein [Tsuneonella deserti]|nr:hypothetical protein [Tsuneonella deserti]
MAREFSREEFYALVWSKPMTHLAKEFAISDVALHKICRKHDIPNPPLGWWAKKAAGKPVTQIPLPTSKNSAGGKVTIAAGQLGTEPELIAAARENARILASSIDAGADTPPNPIVERTAAKLRKAKPNSVTGLVSVEGAGLIKATIAPASVDRFELALGRIVAAADALGIKLVRGDKGAAFECDDETMGFSVTEGTRREKHVPTEKELAEQEAARRRRARRWNSPGSWDDDDFSLSFLRGPEWDYHPTGKLSFELENCYLLGGGPRRSFRDAKVQRLETMASDIAVGMAVLAAAKKADSLRRAEEARQREEARRRRELALRAQHVENRRAKALDKILEDVGALERLRSLVTALRTELASQPHDARVEAFLAFAERRLADRETALSASGLANRFAEKRLFGEDDDHDFRLPHYY